MWLIALLVVTAGVQFHCQGVSLDYYGNSYGYGSNPLEEYSGYYYTGYPDPSYGYNTDYAAYLGNSYVSKTRCRRYTCQGNWNNPCCHSTPCTTVACPPPPPPTSPPCTQVYCPNYTNRPEVICPASRPPAQPCPYAGRRRRRFAQRSCHLNSQCPSDSLCCNDECSFGNVCKKSTYQYQNTTLPESKVKVTVVMTSGCSDAAWFLKEQLQPVLKYFHSYVDTEIVAYGRIQQNGECQFGSADCFGNWLVACSERYMYDQDAHVNFTTCLTQYNYALQGSSLEYIWTVAQYCAENIGSGFATWPYISNCASGTEGFELFQAAGRRQQALVGESEFLPVVAFNEIVVLKSLSDLGYFSYYVCQMLKGVPGTSEICNQVFGHY